MSKSDKPDLARGFLRAEKLLDEEADRLATMSDEDFEREMAAMPDPKHVPTVEQLLAKGVERAAKRGERVRPPGGANVKALPVQPRRAPRTQWISLLAAAAIGGLVVALVMKLWEPPVSHPRPHDDAGGQQEPTQNERAARLREEAFAACRAQRWAECEGQLDEARRLDPAGDADPRVMGARQTVLQALHADGQSPGLRDKR